MKHVSSSQHTCQRSIAKKFIAAGRFTTANSPGHLLEVKLRYCVPTLTSIEITIQLEDGSAKILLSWRNLPPATQQELSRKLVLSWSYFLSSYKHLRFNHIVCCIIVSSAQLRFQKSFSEKENLASGRKISAECWLRNRRSSSKDSNACSEREPQAERAVNLRLRWISFLTLAKREKQAGFNKRLAVQLSSSCIVAAWTLKWEENR